MSDRRSSRGHDRTDAEIRAHVADIDLLREVAAGQVVNSPDRRMDLRRLARDELIVVGFAMGAKAILQPRGERLLAGG